MAAPATSTCLPICVTILAFASFPQTLSPMSAEAGGSALEAGNRKRCDLSLGCLRREKSMLSCDRHAYWGEKD
jgi:hypothetical protein